MVVGGAFNDPHICGNTNSIQTETPVDIKFLSNGADNFISRKILRATRIVTLIFTSIYKEELFNDLRVAANLGEIKTLCS